MRIGPAGDLDRRLLIQLAVEGTDAAGDPVLAWDDAFKLWARRIPRQIGSEQVAEGGVLRDYDLVFEVRDGASARTIAPESHRILYKGRVHEIVGVRPGLRRADRIDILVSSRPDQRGSRGTEGASGEP